MAILYIMATSERPDPYINVIAFTVQYHRVNEIFITVISEPSVDASLERKPGLLATAVLASINEQLTSVSAGTYVRKDPKTGKKVIVPLSNTSGLAVYRRCLEVMNQGSGQKVIQSDKLDETLREYVLKGDCLVDVTALKNNLVVDVVATLLSIGFRDVYSFEILTPQTHDQPDLYHNLKLNEDFRFNRLTDSHSVRKSLKRIGQWSATKQRIMFGTLAAALAGFALSYFLPRSVLLTSVYLASAAASIGSFLALFIRFKG
jgi:hypothetical protein